MTRKPPSPRWDQIKTRNGDPASVGDSVDNFLRKQLGIHVEDDLEQALKNLEQEMQVSDKPDTSYPSYTSQELSQALSKTLTAWEWDFGNESFRSFLRSLVGYFSQQNEKGLLIVGPPGLGKSKVMRLMSKMIADTEHAYDHYQVSRIVRNWKDLQKATAEDLSRKLVSKVKRDYQGGDERMFHLCIDDIGREIKEKMFDYGKNPIRIVIEARHLLWEQHSVKTHLITNYPSEELQEMYGPALFDRMVGMSHVIKIEGNSKR